MRRSPRPLGLVLVAGLLALSACGGDDDAAPADEPAAAETVESAEEPAAEPTAEPAPEPAEEPIAEPADEPVDEPVESTDDPADEGETVFISGIDELPQECVDRVAEMLREIEPVVGQVDWDTASLDDLDEMMLEVEDEFAALDEGELASGCSRYEFEDEEESFAAMVELAEREAPGAVAWLTFVQTVFSAMPGGDGAAAVDGPTDCESAIAYLEELVADGATMSSLPVTELAVVSQAFTVVTEDCELDVMNEFMERPDVTAFLS